MLHERFSHVDGLVQERRNSIALAMELYFSCTNPSGYKVNLSWPQMVGWKMQLD